MITFTPDGPNLLCTTVETVDDSIVEDIEMYSFSFQSDDKAISEIVPEGGQIILLDNDRKLM